MMRHDGGAEAPSHPAGMNGKTGSREHLSYRKLGDQPVLPVVNPRDGLEDDRLAFGLSKACRPRDKPIVSRLCQPQANRIAESKVENRPDRPSVFGGFILRRLGENRAVR
jgi:hypothetical protein